MKDFYFGCSHCGAPVMLQYKNPRTEDNQIHCKLIAKCSKNFDHYMVLMDDFKLAIHSLHGAQMLIASE